MAGFGDSLKKPTGTPRSNVLGSGFVQGRKYAPSTAQRTQRAGVGFGVRPTPKATDVVETTGRRTSETFTAPQTSTPLPPPSLVTPPSNTKVPLPPANTLGDAPPPPLPSREMSAENDAKNWESVFKNNIGVVFLKNDQVSGTEAGAKLAYLPIGATTFVLPAQLFLSIGAEKLVSELNKYAEASQLPSVTLRITGTAELGEQLVSSDLLGTLSEKFKTELR